MSKPFKPPHPLQSRILEVLAKISSMSEIERQTGIPAGQLSKVQKGDRNLTDTQAEKLANFLNGIKVN